VLVQAREDLIERTVQSLVGAKRVIIHLYNSTSPAQRRVVFGKSKDEIRAIAVQGARWIQERLPRLAGTDVRLQYSPESFSATEVEFAKEISEAVMDVWHPTPERRMILNLPDTVEVAMPNVYADQIEWICRNIRDREALTVSLHTHNDRSTGVAATELGLLAGADRVEGTLFGNGERTGNLDIVTVALNLYMHGIDPQLDLGDLNAIREVYERCTGMTIAPRHPYAGELVFTAFSGSHQDAIKKGLAEWAEGGRPHWDVPYLTIDPADIGREYREVIRVNSQSGKGGVAYIMKAEHGFDLPRRLQIEFSQNIQHITEDSGTEISPMMLWDAFKHEYLPEVPSYNLISHELKSESITGHTEISAQIDINGTRQTFIGKGNGPIDAFVHAIRGQFSGHLDVKDYSEHALGQGSQATAVAYVETGDDSGHNRWGVGIDPNTITASLRAVLSAFQRHEATRKHK
jgi:2-isopropylmalate synthase